jgi:hypothetical protein
VLEAEIDIMQMRKKNVYVSQKKFCKRLTVSERREDPPTRAKLKMEAKYSLG